MPAYAAFQRFFEDEYRRAARTTIGASALPEGRDYYADVVRHFTTLADATPESIHATGLAEVARIRADMETILRDIDHRGDFCRLSRLPAHRSPVPREVGDGAAARGGLDREGDRRQAAGLFRPAAAHALRGKAGAGCTGAELHRRALQPRTDRSGGRVLGEHVRARHPAPLRAAGADAARGGARASPAGRARARALRPAGLPPQLLPARVRRRLGALLREAGRGDGRLSHAVSALRAPHVRDVARLPPRRRYRPARDGLDARAGPGLPRVEHRIVDARDPHRSRPLHRAGRARRSPTRSAS